MKKYIFIIGTFTFAFGIALKAILISPKNIQNFKSSNESDIGNSFYDATRFFYLDAFIDILEKAYWPFYGEIPVLDDIRNAINRSTIEEQLSGYAAFLLLVIYMGFSSLLLVNIVIAMFR